jgi:hypothetical protein
MTEVQNGNSMNDDFERTDDLVGIDEIVEMYEFERGSIPETIAVCDGEWRFEGPGHFWRFYLNPARAA